MLVGQGEHDEEDETRGLTLQSETYEQFDRLLRQAWATGEEIKINIVNP